METPAIELRNITKRFGSIVANKDINLVVNKGEILSLLGENGSGKTTLMNMISGIYYPDAGQIFIDGKEVVIKSPKDAFEHKIGMIHQHFKLVDIFSATENIVLGLKEDKFNIKESAEQIKKISEQYGFEIDPTRKIYDMSDLTELSYLILKKKMKKFEKAGIPASLAFDVLSIIPCKEALKSSQMYRIHALYDTLYEHAKTTQIDFDKLIDLAVDEDYHLACITFALLERKEKFSKLTDSQKTLYLAITNWCFNTMEKKLKKQEVYELINIYVKSRIRDDKNGRDSNRRYSLSSLSEEDYPRIATVVKRIIADDDSVKKYL